MKARHYTLMLMACAGMALTSCADEYSELLGWTLDTDGTYIVLSDQSAAYAEGLYFRYIGGSQDLHLESEGKVVATSSASWLAVNVQDGNVATLTAPYNESTSPRTADVRFTLADTPNSPVLVVKVTQRGAASVMPDNLRIEGASFKLIKGASYTMGAGDDVPNAFANEKPAHTVTLSDYYLAANEVTQEMWYAVMGSYAGPDGSQATAPVSGSNIPASYVSFDDCQQFIGTLTQKTGYPFRLPTEAEWEYAARGGAHSQSFLYAGSNSLNEVAWHLGNSKAPSPVGLKQANALGLHDMSGNVWEWCSDYYGGYDAGAAVDPFGAASSKYRVVRGGGWHAEAVYCRVTNRDYALPTSRTSILGLRLAIGAPKIQKTLTLSFGKGTSQTQKLNLTAAEVAKALGLTASELQGALKDGKADIVTAGVDLKAGPVSATAQFGGWFDDKNQPCLLSDNGGHVCVEVTNDNFFSWTCGVHEENNVCAVGDEHVVNMLYRVYSQKRGWCYALVEVTLFIDK